MCMFLCVYLGGGGVTEGRGKVTCVSVCLGGGKGVRVTRGEGRRGHLRSSCKYVYVSIYVYVQRVVGVGRRGHLRFSVFGG